MRPQPAPIILTLPDQAVIAMAWEDWGRLPVWRPEWLRYLEAWPDVAGIVHAARQAHRNRMAEIERDCVSSGRYST